MKDSYDRSIGLICPVCGGKQFNYDQEIENCNVICVQCKKEFTRNELNEANQENIAVNLDEIKKEVVNDLKNDFKNMFNGNKHFRIK